MKEINKFLEITLIVFFSLIVSAESKILSIGNSDAKVTVKVFSSLTCSHCANFHNAIFNNLKEDYIDKGLVKFKNFKKNKNKANYIYVLTPKGISEKTKLTLNFMKRMMKEYDDLNKELRNA